MSGIDWPCARTHMTPCIARDGSTALADDGVCVGCGAYPVALLAFAGAVRAGAGMAEIGSC